GDRRGQGGDGEQVHRREQAEGNGEHTDRLDQDVQPEGDEGEAGLHDRGSEQQRQRDRRAVERQRRAAQDADDYGGDSGRQRQRGDRRRGGGSGLHAPTQAPPAGKRSPPHRRTQTPARAPERRTSRPHA